MTATARWDKFIRQTIEAAGIEWVRMTDIRKALDERGTSREAQDQHLKRMNLECKIYLSPDSDRKTLTEADHAAAVRLGGDESHMVKLLA